MSNYFNIQNSNNIFSLFPQYDLEQAEGVKKEATNPQVNAEPQKDTVEIESKKKSTGKKILFGSTIASSILTAGILGLVLAKGVHGSSIRSISRNLSKELQEASSLSTRKTVYYAKKGTEKTLNTLQATSNFTAIKDTICDRLFGLTKPTRKFAEGSREGFRKVVDRTLGKKYDKVGVQVSDMASLLQKYNAQTILQLDEAELLREISIKGKTKTLGEWGRALQSQAGILEQSFDEGFSLGARKVRSVKRTGLIKGIRDKISERFFKNGGLFKPSNYKTYVTEDLTRSAQEEIKRDIVGARKKVTNNITNIHNGIKSGLSDVSRSINPKDRVNVEIIDSVKQNLEAFRACSGAAEAETREKISQKMIEGIDRTLEQIKGCELYSPTEQKELISKLEKVRLSIFSANENSKGALENIMTILKGLNSAEASGTGKKIISDSEFKQFEKMSKGISSGLKQATEKEMGEYFLKQAEMEVGSAATDVLSVLFPIGAGAYALGKCDDKDERISTALKTCIPLVGTFATFVYGTTKMFSGAKNLMFSAVSGFALNKLGCYLDSLYQKYKKTGSVVEVAKGEYDNIWNEISAGITGEEITTEETKNSDNKSNKKKKSENKNK